MQPRDRHPMDSLTSNAGLDLLGHIQFLFRSPFQLGLLKITLTLVRESHVLNQQSDMFESECETQKKILFSLYKKNYLVREKDLFSLV
jgi:hypothetical protein